MKLVKQVYYLSFLIFLISCSSDDNSLSISDESSFFQNTIDSIFLSHPNSVGIMAHIESPKKGLSWSGCTGYSDSKNKVPIEADQPALIASSIKTYISASILRLQENNQLTIEDPVSKHLSLKTVELFESGGYEMDSIRIKHLLSHTSGIEDYANEDYIRWIDNNKKYRWTRDEQLALAIEVGNPLGKPEDLFSYADANFLLCTEIIEQITNRPFYESMRELLKYKELNFTDTWFPTLEKQNKETKPLVHQYWGEMNWDSYDHDISWDLYGGGGIATTTKELAQFSHNLFNGKIIQSPDHLNQIFNIISTRDSLDNKYCLGLSEGNIKGYKSYGHGGFWGTTVLYYPELETSISVFVLDRDMKNLRNDIMESLILELTKNK